MLALGPLAALCVTVGGPSPAVRAAPRPSAQYGNFDWNQHWYPVAWARDLPLDQPVKVSVLDEDYCVVRRGSGRTPVALRDACPHRLAALSEGRVTEQGLVQCSYHGWAFDGETGACESIPQLVKTTPAGRAAAGGGEPPAFVAPPRSCADAVACQIVDGLFWIHPTAKRAEDAPLPIPRVPEMALPGYKHVGAVRDFPVDYSLLIENVLDPDHGLFAHQAVGFDLYSASAARPVTVSVDAHGGADAGGGGGAPVAPVISGWVDAVPKLTAEPGGPPDAPLKATTRFSPPCLIYMGRRDTEGASKFVTCFWIVPAGVGRTRFISAAVGVAPVLPPRWVQHIVLNNFLDEDTFLLATQQPRVLGAELESHHAQQATEAAQPGAEGGGVASAPLRRRLFSYASPSEKLLLEAGRFLDQALPNMPRRYARPELLRAPTPPREVVLDRAAQHLAICPDSQALVRNCARARAAGAIGAALLVLAKLGARAAWGARSCALLGALLALAKGADALLSEFRFKRDRARHVLGLRKINKVFPDEWLVGAR